MGFIKLNCPSCGASISLDSGKEYGFCSYCGTKIVQDKIVVEHRGKVSVDGIISESSLLDRAYLFVEDGKFDQAAEYFDRVLDINPRCSSAYLGKLLCQLGYRNTSILVEMVERPLSNYDNFNKAKRFAQPDEIGRIDDLENAVLNRIKGIEKTYQASIDASHQRIEQQNDYLENKKNEQIKRVAKGTGLLVLNIVQIILAIFISIVVFVCVSDPELKTMAIIILIFIALPVYVGTVFTITRYVKNKKEIKNYQMSKKMLTDENQQLTAKINKYESWKKNQQKTFEDKTYSQSRESERMLSKPLNNVNLIRTKPHMFGNSPIAIFIDNNAYAQAPKSGTVSLNLSQGTHTMYFKSGKFTSDIIPISINDLNIYNIKYELGYLSIKTDTSVEYSTQ